MIDFPDISVLPFICYWIRSRYIQCLFLGAAVGSSLLATALSHGSHSSSTSTNRTKKHGKNERPKKKQKHSHLLGGAGNFDNGINHLSTSTPISKQKHSKFRVPLTSHEDDMTTSKTTDPLAVDKLLREIVETRFQPFE